MMTSPTLPDIRDAIRNVPDFPQPGIQFKDITPVLANPGLFQASIDLLCGNYQPGDVDMVAGIDARGFIFATAVALKLKAGFVPIRKKGKLPWSTHEADYDLEYGTNTIAIHTDAFPPGARVLLVDDLLATGGTAGAAVSLLKRLEAHLLEAIFLIELTFLKGRLKLPGVSSRSLIQF